MGSSLGITGTHSTEVFPDPADAVWIDSPAALASALNASFGGFQDSLHRVPERSVDEDKDSDGNRESG